MLYDYLPYRIATSEEYKKFSEIAVHAVSIADYTQNPVLKFTEQSTIADIYDAVGCCFGNIGSYQYSIDSYEKALKIYITEDSEESPTVAALLNNIGETYNDWGKMENAFLLYNRGLKIRKKVYGINNPFTAQSYNNIGTIWCLRCDYRLAYQYYKKALKIRIKKLGKDAVELSTSYNTLGDLFFREGKYHKALKYFKKDVELLYSFNPQDPDLLSGEVNIGNIYSSLGDLDEALQHYFTSLKLSLALNRENQALR
jgi:tetratricopeptide (TPR) repeat protein